MLIQKKFNLREQTLAKKFKTNNTPSGAKKKKHRESTEPESHQTVSFFLLLLQTG